MLETVAIIGGGFSGVMTAINLLRQNNLAIEIFIIEPKEVLGLGLAYSTTNPDHLLNVPASHMSAFPDEPNHFFEYARTTISGVLASDFLPRMAYGKYLQWLMNKAIAGYPHSQGGLKHIKSAAIDIEKKGHDYLISLDTKTQIRADFVVLALGNLSGKKPRWLDKVDFNSKRYLHNPWNKSAISAIPANEDVLLVGTGLTAIDKIIELTGNGHKGRIFAVSRHGLFPQAHLKNLGTALELTKIESLSLLEAFSTIKDEARRCNDWRSTMSGLRPIIQNYWRSLSLKEQRSFISHLQTYWDIHRHRMAPEIAAKITKLQQSGQVALLAGRIVNMEEIETGLITTIRHRGTEELMNVSVSTVVNCTGPQSGLASIDSSLLAKLQTGGLIRSHPLGTGMDCQPNGQTIDSKGKVSTQIFAIGPLLKAVLFESVAVPELRQQATNMASLISKLIQEKRLQNVQTEI